MARAAPAADLIADLTAVFQHLGKCDEVTVKLDKDDKTGGRILTVALQSSEVTPVGLLGKTRLDAISKTVILPIKMKKPLY